MLQQTTVEAVRRRYDGFLARFPSLSTLARAREDSVLAAWSGLGYYARARNLRRAAREILFRHDGVFPRDPRVLARLPGLGDYTAAAVASLAFGVPAPAADANVTRVVSRLFAIGGLAGSRPHREAVLERVAQLLPARRPGDLTAALMDLGQEICTPRQPACVQCPLGSLCRGRRQGAAEAYPHRRAKPGPVKVVIAAAVVQHGDRALLMRRQGGFLQGMWEFPCGPASGQSRSAARRHLSRTLTRLRMRRDARPSAAVVHTVVNRRLEIEVFRGRTTGSAATAEAGDTRWFSASELARAAIPTLTRKIARAAGFL